MIAGLDPRRCAACDTQKSLTQHERFHVMSRGIAAAFVLICISLSGCGYSSGDRAVSGGLLGAGAGAAIGAATGGSPLAGAAIGGVVGAVGGAATSHNDINFGRPVWR
jgi:hypothetical protein